MTPEAPGDTLDCGIPFAEKDLELMLRPFSLLNLIAASLLLCSSCSPAASIESDALDQFERENYTASAQLYRELLQRNPQDSAVLQHLAASLFADDQLPELVSLSPALAYPNPPTPLLIDAAQRMGLTPADLSSPRLSQDDIPYLRRAELYHALASRLTLQADSPEEKLDALFDWTVRNIQSAPIASHPELPAWPAQVMLRGYGACDRSAWVFVSLARQLGFPAYLVVLWDPQADTSPHALAGVLHRGKLLLFDTFYGVRMELPAGGQAGLNDVVDDPQVLSSLRETLPDYRVRRTHFQNAIVTIAPEPEALTSRMRFLQSALSHLAPPPQVSADLNDELSRLAEALYGEIDPSNAKLRYLDPRRPYAIDLWGYPFNLRYDLGTAQYQEQAAAAYSYLIPLLPARDAQISGNLETSIRRYSSLLSSKLLPPPVAADAKYFRALAMYDLGLYEDAASELQLYLDAHPDGAWAESSRYNLGLALEKSGRPDKAREAYRAIRETPRAAAAAFRLRELEKELGATVVHH